MNAAASAVMHDIPDISVAYGVSDEYRSLQSQFKRTLNLKLILLKVLY